MQVVDCDFLTGPSACCGRGGSARAGVRVEELFDLALVDVGVDEAQNFEDEQEGDCVGNQEADTAPEVVGYEELEVLEVHFDCVLGGR